MNKPFSALLLALVSCLSASQAHAQFSSASGPVTPPQGSEANPFKHGFYTLLASGETQYQITPVISDSWYAAPLKSPASGAALPHGGFQISSGFNGNELNFSSIQIGIFQGNALSVRVNGQVISDSFASGSVLNFAPNVHSFEVFSRNGSLPVTSSDSLFPLLLKFTGSASTLVWTSISAVPETETYVLMLLGLAVLGGNLGRRKAKA